MPIKRIPISAVTLHHLFFQHSAELGYTPEIIETYKTDIYSLITQWEQQGFVEVYSNPSERKFGRIKDSNQVLGSSPYYINIYHSRVVDYDNDPLVVLKFHGDILSIRFMTDHHDMFGPKHEKGQKAKKYKERIFHFIKLGDETL